MSLLDSDKEVIKQTQEQKKSNRKASTSGLNRFKSLNKFKKMTSEFREKEIPNEPETVAFKETTPATIEPANDQNSKQTLEVAEIKPQTINQTKETILEATQISAIEPVEIKSPQVKAVDIVTTVSSPAVTKTTVLDDPKPTKKENVISNKSNEYIASTNRVQQDHLTDHNKITTKKQIDNKQSTEKSTTRAPSGVHLSTQNSDVRMLVGQNKRLLNIFFQDCKRQGSLSTGRFTNEFLSEIMEVKPSTLKTLIFRLDKGEYIERLPGKKGRGGWIRISLPKGVYDQLINLENSGELEKLEQDSVVNKVTIGSTIRSTEPSSSSSNFILNNNTTTTDEWNIVQIPQNVRDIGFSMAHVHQVARDGVLTVEELQSSLDAFSFDLNEGTVRASLGPFRLFMGVLRKQKVPYVSETFIDRERQELERYLEKRTNLELVKKQMAEDALLDKFTSWWSGLSQDKKNKIAEPSSFVVEGSDIQEKIARGLFLENPHIVENI